MARSKLTILFLALAFSASAANHYIRSGASGANTGNNWTDALTALPSSTSWVRGDTYYIGDSTFAHPPSLSTAASGSTVITIKKATIADHGTSTGWDDTYGDGEVDFGANALSIDTSYWVFSGVSRSTTTNGYGFRWTGPTGGGAGIWIEEGASNYTVSYCNVTGHIGTAAESGGSSGDNAIWLNTSSGKTAQSGTFSYNRFYGWNCCIMKALGGTTAGMLFEHNRAERNHSSAAQHAEGVFLWGQNSNIWRYNEWVDIEGTGVIMLGNGSANQIYGEQVWWTSTYPNSGQGSEGGYLGNGVFSTWSAYASTGNFIHHNTIIVPNVASAFGIKFLNSSSSATSYNNMFVCPSANQNVYSSFTTHDYNYYKGLTHDSESHAQTGSTDLFVDLAGRNLRLTGHTTAGTTLGSPYDQDPDGHTRSTPDRGAFEYVAGGGDTTPPTVTITTPTSSPTYTQSSAPISIAGTSSDDTAVTIVTASMSGATTGSISISGTTSWSGSTTLNGGDTTIVVTAFDAAGNNSSDTLVVTYNVTAAGVVNVTNLRVGP